MVAPAQLMMREGPGVLTIAKIDAEGKRSRSASAIDARGSIQIIESADVASRQDRVEAHARKCEVTGPRRAYRAVVVEDVSGCIG